MKPLADQVQEILQRLLANAAVYAIALVVLLVALLVAIVAARQVRSWVARTGAPYGVQNLLALVARIVIVVVGLTIGLGIAGLNLAPLLAGVGVIGLVLGIALKDPLENFMAGFVLLIRQPYTVGDRIVSQGYEGTVTEVNLRSTVIRTYNGESVHLPNGLVLRSPLVNKTAYPVTRTTVDLRVPFETDLARAMEVAGEAVRSVEGVQADPAVEVAVLDFDERGAGIQVRYWTESLGATVNRVSIAARRRLKEAFDREGIEFAMPLREAFRRAARDSGDGAGEGAAAQESRPTQA